MIKSIHKMHKFILLEMVDMVQRVKKREARAGFFSVVHAIYFEQFPGLREKLQNCITGRIGGMVIHRLILKTAVCEITAIHYRLFLYNLKSILPLFTLNGGSFNVKIRHTRSL